MPLIDSINLDNTNIFIWKITENKTELQENLPKQYTDNQKFKSLKLEKQQLCFLAVRQIIHLLNINDIEYNEYGKPFLKNNQEISISHCFPYVLIALSSKKIGIDIEKKQQKIINISSKFIDNFTLFSENIYELTKIWTAKESLYKAFGKPGINFKKDIQIQSNLGIVTFKQETEKYNLFWKELNEFILCIAIKN